MLLWWWWIVHRALGGPIRAGYAVKFLFGSNVTTNIFNFYVFVTPLTAKHVACVSSANFTSHAIRSTIAIVIAGLIATAIILRSGHWYFLIIGHSHVSC